MKTKVLLLTALVTAATAASVLAQGSPVYSVNSVGYVTANIPAGFSIVCNPLNTTNNTLGALIPNPPENTLVYKYNGTTFQIASFSRDDFDNLTWDHPEFTLNPGDAAWIKPPSAFTATWIGEVSQGNLTNTIPNGLSLQSSKVPQAGAIDTVLGFTPANGDLIYLFRNNSYKICSYSEDDFGQLNWDVVPDPGVGEGFWVKNSTGSTRLWTRTFSVNTP